MISLHFLRVYWLLALLPLGFLLWQLKYQRWHQAVWSKVCDAHLLPKLLLNYQSAYSHLPLVLLSIAWLLAVLALAGPSWTRDNTQVFRSNAAQVIVLDLSPSMYARDVKPNRLERSKFKILDLLKKTRDSQIGMVVFSQQAFLVSPLTEDADTLAAMVPELSPAIMPTLGNNMASGLEKAQSLFSQAGFGRGQIILVTDSEPNARSFSLAKQLKQQGIRINILGVGEQQGAPIPTRDGYLKDATGAIINAKLPSKALQRLAKAGGGDYVKFSGDNSDIDRLNTLNTSGIKRDTKKKQFTEHWQDQGRWLVWLLLPLAALAFRRGWLESIISE